MTPLRIEGGLLFTSGRIAYGRRILDLRHLLLDTGSAASVFSADALFDVGLVPRPEDHIRRIRGVGGTEFVFARRIDRLEVGDLSLGDFEIEVGALDYGFRMDGLVGLDFLAASGAVLDLGRMELRRETPPASPP